MVTAILFVARHPFGLSLGVLFSLELGASSVLYF